MAAREGYSVELVPNYPIRPAVETDAPFLADVMLLSSRSHVRRGIWDRALGGTEQSRRTYLTQMALVEPRCPTHYSHFIVAEADGQPAAALCGYGPPVVSYGYGVNAMSEVDKKLGGAAGASLSAKAAFEHFGSCAWKDEMQQGAWIIESVATLPQFRRRGLVTTLLGSILEKGRLQRYHVARVSVFINNSEAEKLYKAAQFEVVGEKRSVQCEQVFGFPGVKLLQRFL